STDHEVSSIIEKIRYKVDRKEREEHREYRVNDEKTINKEYAEKKHSYKRRFKLLDILDKCEKRYEYDRWERLYIRMECMEDKDGYIVKANQKRRKEWTKSI